MDEHKGHDTVSAAAEMTEKQTELGVNQKKINQKIKERESEVKKVNQAVDSLNRSALTAVENSERIFTELIQSIEKRRSEVKQLIVSQQRAAVSQAEGFLERLEQEICDLRRREVELEQLAHTDDHIHFLQLYSSLSSSCQSSDLPIIDVQPLQYFADVTDVVSKLRDKMEDVLKDEWTNISKTVGAVDLLEPQTRADFLRYSCHVTLDPNTAQQRLSLSQGNRKVTIIKQQQPYPPHLERFTIYCQVLSKEGLSGRCYWEFERSGEEARIAASYKDIERSGDISVFGQNDKSWCLECSWNGYSFKHNKVVTAVSGPVSNRTGVYLDHSAGTLSFYSVSDTMTLLHRVHTTFTQPLYPGIGLGYGSMWNWGDSAEFLQVE